MTVLAPLFFLLYIDDIETNIDSKMRLFVGNSLVYRVIKHDSDCLQLQKDHSSLCDWESSGEMILTKQCCVMHMMHKKNLCLSTHNMKRVPLVPTNTTTNV